MGVRLERRDWIKAGLARLASGGIDAVRVEPMAAALGVTKGSFYWHFADRGAYLAGLLADWQTRAAGAVIERVDAAGGDAATRLHRLFEIAWAVDGRLDLAVRHWAGQDAQAAAAVAAVDATRLGYLTDLFAALGLDLPQLRARLVYHALLGHYLRASAPQPGEIAALHALVTRAP